MILFYAGSPRALLYYKSLPVKGAAINAVIVIVYFYDRSFCVVNASADDSAMCMYFERIMFSNQMVYFRSHIKTMG